MGWRNWKDGNFHSKRDETSLRVWRNQQEKREFEKTKSKRKNSVSDFRVCKTGAARGVKKKKKKKKSRRELAFCCYFVTSRRSLKELGSEILWVWKSPAEILYQQVIWFCVLCWKIQKQNRQLVREAVCHWDTCGLYVIELVCFFLEFCFWTVWMPWLVISMYMSMYLKDAWGVVFRRLWISNFCV